MKRRGLPRKTREVEQREKGLNGEQMPEIRMRMAMHEEEAVC